MTWGHRIVLGKTWIGKTQMVKSDHEDPAHHVMDVFVDTKGNTHTHTPAVRCGGRLVLPTVRRLGRLNWKIPQTHQLDHFSAFTDETLRVARHVEDPFLRMRIDEAQRFGRVGTLRGEHYLKGPLERLASEGQGLGVECWFITQRPAGLHGAVLDNMHEAVVFHINDQAKKTVREWGWPVDDWDPWIRPGADGKPTYRFITYDGNRTKYHPPVKA